MSAEAVNHPPHYTSHPSGVETIEITEHLDCLLGNAVKYILRADIKGKPVEDREKCLWYLRRYNHWIKRHPLRSLMREYGRYFFGVGSNREIRKLLKHDDRIAVYAVLFAARHPTPVNINSAITWVESECLAELLPR